MAAAAGPTAPGPVPMSWTASLIESVSDQILADILGFLADPDTFRSLAAVCRTLHSLCGPVCRLHRLALVRTPGRTLRPLLQAVVEEIRHSPVWAARPVPITAAAALRLLDRIRRNARLIPECSSLFNLLIAHVNCDVFSAVACSPHPSRFYPGQFEFLAQLRGLRRRGGPGSLPPCLMRLQPRPWPKSLPPTCPQKCSELELAECRRMFPSPLCDLFPYSCLVNALGSKFPYDDLGDALADPDVLLALLKCGVRLCPLEYFERVHFKRSDLPEILSLLGREQPCFLLKIFVRSDLTDHIQDLFQTRLFLDDIRDDPNVFAYFFSDSEHRIGFLLDQVRMPTDIRDIVLAAYHHKTLQMSDENPLAAVRYGRRYSVPRPDSPEFQHLIDTVYRYHLFHLCCTERFADLILSRPERFLRFVVSLCVLGRFRDDDTHAISYILMSRSLVRFLHRHKAELQERVPPGREMWFLK